MNLYYDKINRYIATFIIESWFHNTVRFLSYNYEIHQYNNGLIDTNVVCINQIKIPVHIYISVSSIKSHVCLIYDKSSSIKSCFQFIHTKVESTRTDSNWKTSVLDS